ncbi:MAG TPA: AI-2E family transporter [Burkholderiales bacterium]|nr:AI-2E family transporter [Burkholderiales bacterium]
MTDDRTFYGRIFALTLILLVLYLLYSVLAPFLAPIAWALFIAFLIHPLHIRLVRRLRGRAAWSAAILTLVVFFMIIGPLAALGAAFAKQVAELARHAQAFAVEHKPADLSDLASLPVIGPALAWLQETAGISLAQIQAWAVEAAQTILKALGTLGRAAFLGALGTVIGFALMMFILFFAIRDGKRIADTVRALLPASEADKARLFAHLASVTRALVYGAGVTALVQGTLVGIGFAVVGLPSPVVFGVLAALAALIPLVGTPVVWVPAVIVLAAQDRWYAALILLVWGVFVTIIDNFLRPWLVSGRAQVDALTVFIGVLGGVSAFGPIGVVLGPLVLALGIALVRFALETNPAGSSGTPGPRA